MICTRVRVARHDRALHGSRAAPSGQERGVKIETSVSWGIKGALRQNLPVGHDASDVNLQSFQVINDGRLAKTL